MFCIKQVGNTWTQYVSTWRDSLTKALIAKQCWNYVYVQERYMISIIWKITRSIGTRCPLLFGTSPGIHKDTYHGAESASAFRKPFWINAPVVWPKEKILDDCHGSSTSWCCLPSLRSSSAELNSWLPFRMLATPVNFDWLIYVFVSVVGYEVITWIGTKDAQHMSHDIFLTAFIS